MARQWHPSELRPRRGTAEESARLSRHAARLLAATATAAAMTAVVATSTNAAIVAPAEQAAAGIASSTDTGQAQPGDAAAARGPQRRPPARRATPTAGTAAPAAPSSTGAATGPAAAGTPAAAPGSAADERVALTDDDAGLPLFAEGALAPGSPRVRCVDVTYAGRSTPAQVLLRVAARGPLASWVQVRVVVGTTTTRDCAGFVADHEVAAGTLAALAAAPPSLTTTASPGVAFGVRIETVLSRSTPSSAQGTSVTGSFVWSTSG